MDPPTPWWTDNPTASTSEPLNPLSLLIVSHDGHAGHYQRNGIIESLPLATDVKSLMTLVELEFAQYLVGLAIKWLALGTGRSTIAHPVGTLGSTSNPYSMDSECLPLNFSMQCATTMELSPGNLLQTPTGYSTVSSALATTTTPP